MASGATIHFEWHAYRRKRWSAAPQNSVVIRNGRIAQVVASEEGLPSDARRIDASRKFILPGLLNANVHLIDGIMLMGIGGDINNIRNTSMVMEEGKVIDTDALPTQKVVTKSRFWCDDPRASRRRSVAEALGEL